jgi:hypothetical protein
MARSAVAVLWCCCMYLPGPQLVTVAVAVAVAVPLPRAGEIYCCYRCTSELRNVLTSNRLKAVLTDAMLGQRTVALLALHQYCP